MQPKLFQAALDEAVKFGPAARLVLTFPGNEDAMHLHPLAYSKVNDDGFRIEVRVPSFDDEEIVDDIIFMDACAVETVELQVKPQGSIWQEEPYRDRDEDEEN